ncbi:MAG: histidine--tRNA ligase [Candidatus Bathyarchaeia archaeon]
MPERLFTLPRGMRDTPPEEMARRLWVAEKIRSVINRYGFRLVEPSPMEHLETLEAKSGPMIRDEIYHFKDKAGRDLGLRFDLTVGMTRMVAGRTDLPEPVKLASIAGMWRYDEPQFARYRYFHQWDLEIYGSSEPAADAEIIAASMDILDEVGLRGYEVLISSRRLVDGYLEAQGLEDQALREQAIRLVDKARKIPREELASGLEALKLGEAATENLLSFIGLAGPPSKTLEKLASLGDLGPGFSRGLENLRAIIEVLDLTKRLGRCRLDMSVVRGLDYYDGMVFEAYDTGGEEIGAILGGGRYDRLGGLYGRADLACTGVAGGIERLFISLERAGLLPELEPPVKLFVAAAGEEARPAAIKLVQEARRVGLPCDMDLRARPLKRQLEYADALKIPYAAIIGPREAEKGALNLRDMKTRREKTISLAEFRKWLAEQAGKP